MLTRSSVGKTLRNCTSDSATFSGSSATPQPARVARISASASLLGERRRALHAQDEREPLGSLCRRALGRAQEVSGE
jgi:hypothetical protein